MFLELDGLHKRFGNISALDNVSLEIESGEFVCFLGPSGCGKTTLLRCIAGLERQDAGRIFQGGTDISLAPPAHRDFGIVFQSYALFPNLTVAANVGYGLTGRNWPRARRHNRVSEMLTLVGLEGHEQHYPAQLSGGQQQRVALARALAPGPSMLLLDEPLSALDAKVRERLRREVKALQEQLGVTTILVTHDQEEALTMAGRVVVMNEGRVAQVGTPQQVYQQPIDPFVADFIGVMNFLPATSNGNGALKLGDGWALNAGGLVTGNAPAETPFTCCIRPQNIGISREENLGNNAVRGRVQTLEYLGASYRALVIRQGQEETPIRVDLPTERLHKLAIAVGDDVAIHLPETELHVFRADGEAVAVKDA